MIINRTPFRISFFGGGTDYQSWCDDNVGAVLNTTINKYCYIMTRYLPPFLKYKYNIRYRKTERKNKLNNILHPTVRECIKYMHINDGIEMVHTADLPAGSGIGSSSSFTVGFLQSLNALQGKMITKRNLAKDAIHIEQDLINENIGSQDQVAASFGGFNKVIFSKNDFVVEKIILNDNTLQKLQDNLLMVFTGYTRTSSEIAGKYINTLQKKKNKELKIMYHMVDISIDMLKNNNIDDFGKLLNESWCLKKSFSDVISNKNIDDMYACARHNGALGGKLCGSGGGGFFILYVPQEKQYAVKKALKKMLFVPIKFENLGSQIIMYNIQDFH
jgi:D-glycero-alpha-D-manno-heptose-7-phosphate kinase